MTIKIKITGPDKSIQNFMPEFFAWQPNDSRELYIKGKTFLFSHFASYTGKAEVNFAEPVEVKSKFTVGDHVTKIEGYKFSGTVKAVYRNKDGFFRVVVEHEEGWAHIFNEGQLALGD